MSTTPITIRRSGLFTRPLSLRQLIVRVLAARSLELAQMRAYQRFAELHPTWAQSLFDQHFLCHAAAPLITRCLNPYAPPIAEEFVLAGWSQLSTRTISPRELAIVLPIAADFLRLLDAELSW